MLRSWEKNVFFNQVMEALVKDKEEMEKLFTIHQQDVDKLKEKEVLSKF